MSLEGLLSQILHLVGTSTPGISLFLFIICMIGEAFVVSIPLVFETTWVAAGYQLHAGVLKVPDLLLMMLSAQLGRQVGALIMYSLSRRGTSFFSRFITRRIPRDLAGEHSSLGARFLRHIDSISPFGVAMGRLFYLRVPLTLLLGARHRLKTLVLGIAISSTIYESVYLSLGAIVGTTHIPTSGYLLLYFAGGLAGLYATFAGIRLAVKVTRRHCSRTGATPGAG